jgi:AcrR family transcriptional regulator
VFDEAEESGKRLATRKRLMDAAAEEFSAFGLAGARVERIAELSRCNKAQIYHYFGSKEALFDAVLNQFVSNNVRVAMDPTDLPAFAARLFDNYEADPRLARLLSWYRLERADPDSMLESMLTNSRAKVRAISKAQRAGDLPTHYSAEDLLALVVSVSAMRTNMPPELLKAFGGRGRAHRRMIVVDSIRRLLEDGAARHFPPA